MWKKSLSKLSRSSAIFTGLLYISIGSFKFSNDNVELNPIQFMKFQIDEWSLLLEGPMRFSQLQANRVTIVVLNLSWIIYYPFISKQSHDWKLCMHIKHLKIYILNFESDDELQWTASIWKHTYSPCPSSQTKNMQKWHQVVDNYSP